MGRTREYADSAARKRAYRLRAKAEGKPVKRGGYWKHPSKFDLMRPFIAIDGEGETVAPGVPQPYWLMMASTGEYIESTREKGLRSYECFDFLIGLKLKYPTAIFVGYGLNYDSMQMIRSFREDQLRSVWSDETDKGTRYLANDNSYYFKFRKSKFTRVIRWSEGVRTSIHIDDVLGFFQTSFVRALKLGFMPLDQSNDLAFIEEMKQKRHEFAAEDRPLVREYCKKECEYLVTLMTRMREELHKVGVKPRMWYGSGVLAVEELQHNAIKAAMKSPPEAVKDAIQRSYAGGRIECCKIGYKADNGGYDYDITSAYPAHILNLPCLCSSHWTLDREPKSPYYLSRIKFDFGGLGDRNTWYPFFWRGELEQIYFPVKGHGWYWNEEAEAGRAYYDQRCHFKNGKLRPYWHFEVREVWNLHIGCDHKPFAFIAQRFADRMASNSEGQKIVLKLLLNSIYGKFVQQVGWRNAKQPPYFQLEWAAMTTAGTRAAMVRAALMTSANNVISFATDGLFVTEPIKDLPMGKRLGEWELKHVCDEALSVGSGIYFIKDRQKGWIEKTRGFQARISGRGEAPKIVKQVREAWRKEEREIPISTKDRFVGLGLATATKEGIRNDFRAWVTDDRRTLRIDGLSTKRDPITDPWFHRLENGYVGMQLNIAGNMHNAEELSAPYTVDERWRGAVENSLSLSDYDE